MPRHSPEPLQRVRYYSRGMARSQSCGDL